MSLSLNLCTCSHTSFPQVPTQTSNLEVDPPGGDEKKKGTTSKYNWRQMNLDTKIIWRQVLNGTENFLMTETTSTS